MNNILDIRTLFIGYVVSNAICAVVMSFLWQRNRKRLHGLGFWMANFIMQFLAVLMISLRGVIPDFFSILAANTLAVAGIIFVYIGMERFEGKAASQIHNYVLLTTFFFIHAYLTYVQPSLIWRSRNFSVATLLVCIQIAWLILHRVNASSRPEISLGKIIFIGFALVNVFRLLFDNNASTNSSFLDSGILNALATLIYQMLYIGLTFFLFLMANHRLITELEEDVAERKHAEAKLEVSMEKYRGLNEAAFEAIFISEKGVCIEQNHAAEKLFGYSSEEAVGKLETEWIVPEDREMVMQNILAGHEGVYEATAIRKDGTTFPCQLHGKTIAYQGKNTQVISLHDISDRKSANISLLESEKRYRTLIENVGEGIGFVNPDEVFILANPAADAIFGVEPGKLLGRSLLEFTTPDGYAEIRDQTRQRYLGERSGYEVEIHRPDGEKRALLVTAVPQFDEQGIFTGTFGVFRDITNRKQADEIVARQSEQLRILYEASQRLNRTLDLSEIYQAVCDSMSSIASNDGFFISAFSHDTQLITCRACWMENNWLDVSEFPPIPLEEEGKGTQSLVIRTGQSLLLNDYQVQAKTARSSYYVNDETNEVVDEIPPDEDVTRSALIVPLKTGGRVNGVIQVMSFRINAYTENQLKLLEALALHIASAEQNATLYSRVQTELNERKLTEKALRDSESRYRAFIHSAINAIISFDAAGNIADWNPCAEAIFGYPEAEIHGQSFSLLLPDRYHPEYVDGIVCVQSSGERRIIRKTTEMEGRRKDGSEFPLELSLSEWRIADEKFQTAIISDITERKVMEISLQKEVHEKIIAQESLAAEKELLSITLMSIDDGVIVTDTEGIVILFNRAAELITGFVLSEAINKPVTDVLRLNISSTLDKISDPAIYLVEMEKAQKKYAAYRSPVLITKTGERLLLSGSITSLKAATLEEETVGFVIVFQNATEKQKVEEQTMLSQKMAAIGQLAAGVAHEINTPIQYVGDNLKFLEGAYSNYTEMLNAFQRVTHENVDKILSRADVERLAGLARDKNIGYFDKEIPKAIQESLDGAERVRKIVLAIREFSHPSEKEKKFYDINHGIETTAVISRSEWKYCAELETDLEGDLPLVYCQIDEINQVVLNMIVNGAQAIQEKQPAGSDQKGIIKVCTRLRDNRVFITIRDSGIGIPRDIRPRIFDPFFTTKGVGKGTGQGLSMAHNIIVNNHHGIIGVDSIPGQGTTFTIELPVNFSELEQG